MTIDDRLEEYLRQIPMPDIARTIASVSAAAPSDMENMLSIFANEARVTLQVVKPYLRKDILMLEIGAGLCFFSLFLRKEGYNIVALEPSSGGFASFQVARNVIIGLLGDGRLKVIQKEAGQLDADKDGFFDLIFSNNVIEHIPDLGQALDAMLAVLNRGGAMVHACPNYVVPYEPHLKIPVIKPWRRVSEFLFPGKIREQKELWDSLNLVTYFDLREFAKRRKVRVRFVRGLLYEAFRRFDTDELFRRRQCHGWVNGLYMVLKWSGLIYVLKYLPVFLSTPMIFEIGRNGEGLLEYEVSSPTDGR